MIADPSPRAVGAVLASALGRRLEAVRVHLLGSGAQHLDPAAPILGETVDGIGLCFDGGMELGFHWTNLRRPGSLPAPRVHFALACVPSAAVTAGWSPGVASERDVSAAPDLSSGIGARLAGAEIYGWADLAQGVVLRFGGAALGVAAATGGSGFLGDQDDVMFVAADEVTRGGAAPIHGWTELARFAAPERR